ncbi:sulfite reductase subunit A [candidate division KSB1 bacterium]|nr:MAG: sulfite reductase subunit A [candidate division KSB1 bacterium]
MVKSTTQPVPLVLEREALSSLLTELQRYGYTVVGPTVVDGSIVHGEVTTVEDLPAGWADEQSPARYRLQERRDQAFFGYHCGPQSWKRFLHPPQTVLWEGVRSGLQPAGTAGKPPHYAFLGVRACELAAILIQDRVMMQGPYADATYSELRKNIFIIAVNCLDSAATCFCASMGSGPRAASHFDLCLTERIDEHGHRFVVEIGSLKGGEILAAIPHKEAAASDIKWVEQVTRAAASGQVRKLDTNGLRDILYEAVEHPRWDDVAARCLSCTNCTMVCPTCFCATVEDRTDLGGTTAQRVRRWDSCFTLDYSYIHGGSVRSSVRARYRHWLTHKLGTWVDQFGTPGCVGCGRCITWCPAGIDLTEEATALKHRVTIKEVPDGND